MWSPGKFVVESRRLESIEKLVSCFCRKSRLWWQRVLFWRKRPRLDMLFIGMTPLLIIIGNHIESVLTEISVESMSLLWRRKQFLTDSRFISICRFMLHLLHSMIWIFSFLCIPVSLKVTAVADDDLLRSQYVKNVHNLCTSYLLRSVTMTRIRDTN